MRATFGSVVIGFALMGNACGSSGGTPTAQDASTRDASVRDGSARDGSNKPASDAGRTATDASQSANADAKVSAPDGSAAGDASSGAPDASAPTLARSFVFVGGYDWGNATSYPFRTYLLNRETGALTQVGDATNMGPNPSYIGPTADGKHLYVANERDDINGGVTTGAVNLETGAVTKLDHVTENVGYVFTSLDPAQKYVLAAAYNAGRVSVFPIKSDHTLGKAVDTEDFGGGAQSHSVRVHRSGKWAYVPNKALDDIAELTFDASNGQLAPNPANASIGTGNKSGPRHIAFDPSGKHAFVIFENSSQLASYEVASDGTLTELDRKSTLPPGFSGTNYAAHVLVHPNGRYVYGSNRGDNSIVVFSVASDGSLNTLEYEPSRGATPRNFDIDSRGELMVVANQDGGSLAVFRIGSDGRLEPLGDLVKDLMQPAAVSIVNVFE